MNTIIEHIDLWTTAQTQKSLGKKAGIDNISLHGINRLRELILELAVRGKLVEQDSNDELASVLLKKIETEKEKLISDGLIKKQNRLPKITLEEKEYNIPKNWEWVRLNEYLDVRDGTHDTPKYKSEGYPLVTSKNLSSGKLDLTDVKLISEQDYLKIIDRSKVDKEDILFAMIGSIGNPVIVDKNPEFAIKNVALFKYYNSKLSCPKYVKLFLEVAAIIMKEKAQGGVQSFVSLGYLRNYVMPLPPLPEQHRIVAKVDELMALCDKLKQQQMNHIETHLKLVEVLLQTLTNATNSRELKAAWQHLEPHFDILFTTGESIDLLKQTILQLAVMGKMVPQDPADEPASVLLKKIEAEKNKLIKAGKLKKQNPLPKITDDEKPFELPDGWKWSRLGDICYVFSGASFKSEDFGEEGGVRVIKITNAGVGEFVETEDYLPEEFLATYQNFIVYENDLILALTRPYISSGLKISKCPSAYNKSLLNQRVAAIRTFLKTDYLFQFMSSSIVLNIYQERFGKSGLQPNLKMSDVTDLLVPVPPEKEQIQIVSKVDELMTLCDQLKERIVASQQLKVKLADAVVERAVAKKPAGKVVYAANGQLDMAAEPGSEID